MKRSVLAVIVIFILITAITGCAPKAGSYNLTETADKLVESDAFSDILGPVTLQIAAQVYGFDSADIEESVIYCSTGATTEEIGLFKCVDEAAAQRVLEKAQARAESQKTIYASYAPAEPPKIDDGYVKRDGVYVFYVISADGDIVRGIMG